MLTTAILLGFLSASTDGLIIEKIVNLKRNTHVRVMLKTPIRGKVECYTFDKKGDYISSAFTFATSPETKLIIETGKRTDNVECAYTQTPDNT